MNIAGWYRELDVSKFFEPDPTMKTINIIKTIITIMTTTISIAEKTKVRLNDYKMGNMTYDDLLNVFMDAISIEDIAKEHIEEHYKRLKTFKAVSKNDFKKRLKSSS